MTKLFVGQLPKHVDEDQLRPIFQEYGDIVELVVLRDKQTQAHKGCAFLTYTSRAAADACIEALHNKYTLPNMSNAVQIKFAQGSDQTPGDIKLFIGMVPKSSTVDDLMPIFAPYGEIEELSILKGPDGQSRGCAFLRYKNRDSAVKAVTTLNNSMKMQGAPHNLVVKFAETDKDKQQKQRKAQPESSTQQALQQLQALASNPVLSVVLEQLAAVSGTLATGGLGQLGTGLGSGLGTGLGTGLSGLGSLGGLGGLSGYGGLGSLGANTNYGGGSYDNNYNNDSPAGSNKEGPAGANLFVYHLPNNFGDIDLYDAFCPFGNVLSAKVFMDRETNMSRCFGFVSFDAPEAAQVAIEQMNGVQVGQKRLKVQLKTNKPGGPGRPY